MIAGFLGCGVGMTTHTENIGVIGVTKVCLIQLDSSS